jgi:hypothetical protein
MDFDDEIMQIAIEDLTFRRRVDAGLMPPAEVKAYEAQLAERVERLDRKRGTEDVKYEQFRAAFEAGAGCGVLFKLRNAMHPKDPLKEAANEDLVNVECYSPRSTRTDST